MSVYDFVAIDFETATAKRNSACSIGIAAYAGGNLVDSFYGLIQPPKNKYSDYNIGIHHITPEMTEDAPTFSELWPDISRFFKSSVPVVAHNAPFDISVFRQSAVGLDIPNFIYADTMSIARYLCPWSQKLTACASFLGVEIEEAQHHDSLYDAMVCAEIMRRGLLVLDCESVFELLIRYPDFSRGFFAPDDEPEADVSPAQPDRSVSYARFSHHIDPSALVPSGEVDEKNFLFGKTIVFTGELSIPRDIAMQMATDHGAAVKSSVVKSTSYLVKGTPIEGFPPISSKERKALELIEKGSALKIIDESEFLLLLEKRCENGSEIFV